MDGVPHLFDEAAAVEKLSADTAESGVVAVVAIAVVTLSDRIRHFHTLAETNRT